MRKMIEQYGDPHLHFKRYPGCELRCGACNAKNDTQYTGIPRTINPASPLADYYKPCCPGGPNIGCMNTKFACTKNGVPYDPQTDLIIPPYSYPYEANSIASKCPQPRCNQGKLNCKH